MLYIESFEAGIMPPWWSGDWEIVSGKADGGTYCIKSKKITDDQESNIELDVELSLEASFMFFYRVSSESNYDKLIFYIDNVKKQEWSNCERWTKYSVHIAAGAHIIRFCYSKDSSGSSGEDAAYLDNLSLENVKSLSVKERIDTLRIIKGNIGVALNFDVVRNICRSIQKDFDTEKKIEKETNSVYDTIRLLGNIFTTDFDTKRTTEGIYKTFADTKRIIAKTIKQSDIDMARVTLSIDNFADRPYIQSRKEDYLNYSVLNLKIGDFEQTITNPDTTITITAESRIYTLTGRPDMTDVLYRDINVEADNLKLSTILRALNVDFKLKEDFTLTSDSVNAYMMYSSVKKIYVYKIVATNLKILLSNMLDWSNSFYEKRLYCNYRNGKIFVTSRDTIEKYYNAENLPVDSLQISRTKVKNMTEAADSAGNQNNTDYEPNKEEPEPTEYLLSGKMSFGDSSVTYTDGLITREVNGDTTTTYDYTSIGSGGSGNYASVSNKYLRKKIVTGKDEEKNDTTTETNYMYTEFAGEIVATVEVTKEYIKKGPNVSRALRSIQTTTFVPIGNGYYGQTITKETYDEDQYSLIPLSKEQTTAMSNGASSGQASLFTIKGAQGHRTSTINPTPPVTIPGRPETNLTCPIVETAIFKQYIELYAAMDGKTEETISASFYSNHIVDVCNTAFVYQNNIYYMSSNSVSKSASGIRQDITAVRWY